MIFGSYARVSVACWGVGPLILLRWACAGRSFTVGDRDHPSQHRTFSPLTNTGGTLAITHTLDGTLHLGCQHSLAVRNNLAIDVAGCRIDVTNQGGDVLNAVAAKIPH
jgi:PknH-like extracellular domain